MIKEIFHGKFFVTKLNVNQKNNYIIEFNCYRVLKKPVSVYVLRINYELVHLDVF